MFCIKMIPTTQLPPFQDDLCADDNKDIKIIFHRKTLHRQTKKKNIKIFEHVVSDQPTLQFKINERNEQSRRTSMPTVSSLLYKKRAKQKVKLSKSVAHKIRNQFQSNYIVNVVSEYRVPEHFQPFQNQGKLRIYRCQISNADDSCCCACNSDAMFEVMKSLYDCYKKKNCDHCNCILCGHLPREERRLGELRKAGIGVEAASTKQKEKMRDKAEKLIVGKSPVEKERILRDLAMSGVAFPDPKTASEADLMKRLRNELGLPPEPKSDAEKRLLKKAEAKGLLLPLEGKTPAEKEKILRGLAEAGVPLPEGRTLSEKSLIERVKATTKVRPTSDVGVGVPSEKLRRAKALGLLTPLEGKTSDQKEIFLRGLIQEGLPLPEGKTASDKMLINKIKAEAGRPSAIPSKMKEAKAAGLLTPLDGKTPEQKEKILRGLAKKGLPLPEGKTASEKKLINKVRAEMGLPPEPKTPSAREKYARALTDGLITPLEGKTPEQKEKILKALADKGVPLPEGRTASEKMLINKIKAKSGRTSAIPSAKIKEAKAAGLLTPLEGKTPEQKEKILKGLAKLGLPLPEGKTASEKKLINKVRAEIGLPPEPKTPSAREKYARAQAAGLITPLEGKTPEQKEKILKALVDKGIPLPEGRTASEKMINKVKAEAGRPSAIPSVKMKAAKAAGLLTPLEGKTPQQKENILKGLAKHGIPLPEGKSDSEKKLIDKVRAEMGLPPEPKSPSIRERYAKAQAAGLITPLEGKTPEQKEKILRSLAEKGIPLPEGRTRSEKSIINKIKAEIPTEKMKFPSKVTSEKLRAAKAAGLLTPLTGKSPEQKENIIRGLAKHGLPLPEGKTTSEKKLIDKIRAEIGLPPSPKTPSTKEKYAEAQAAGLITPLEGKTPAQKEKILRALAQKGIPLPEGRTPSEKALINKVKAEGRMGVPSAKLKAAKAAGLLTPLDGKTPEQKEKILKGLIQQGLPLPEGKTASDKMLINKIKAEAGRSSAIQSAKLRAAKAAGLLTPLTGKTPAQKEKILKGLAKHGIPLPEAKTASEQKLIDKVRAEMGLSPEFKTPSSREKYKRAQAAGLITPLEGKTPIQKEKILRALAEKGIPLPEGRTPSEKALINMIKTEVPMGVPSAKLRAAKAAGLLTPLEGKTSEQKEKILRGLIQQGLPLPAVKTASDKMLINKIKAEAGRPSAIPSAKMKAAKAAGLLTPLEGKTPQQKENILKGLAKHGIPLPEAKTASEQKMIDKVRAEMGLPPEPKTPSLREKYRRAQAAGFMTPLEGKTPAQKDKILRALAEKGIPLPEGRTPSEKALINKMKAEVPIGVPSAKFRAAKAAGLLTPLEGKTPDQKEKILRGLAKHGIPLPEGKTTSEKKLIDKVRAEMGLPPEPKTPSTKENYARAQAAGLITPLEGKTPAQKEKIFRALAAKGIPLPEGRTPSEKALINKVKAEVPMGIPSAKLKAAKAAGLLTPLEGKSPEQKEKILRGLVKAGLPLPLSKTPSEKKLMDKIRKEMGLPPEPTTPNMKEKYAKAQAAGLMEPLEGKTPAQKEKILQGQFDAGIPLPEGRTPSEKALIAAIKAGERRKSFPPGVGKPALPPDQRAKLDAKTAKVVTEGKGPSDECICGLLTPEAERTPVGRPSEETRKITSEKLRAAKAAGLLTPLTSKTPEQKEKILRGLAKQGLPFPEGKTASERKLIEKVRAELGLPPSPRTPSAKEKYASAQAAGLVTPLEGKTPAQKEKILRRLAEKGIPLPEGRTPSEKALINRVKAEVGASMATPSAKLRAAKAAGLITPLEGKTPAQKEKILRALAAKGIPLPEGRTASEKALINRLNAEIPIGVPSAKLRAAKAAGLLTPLAGKTPEQREKILKGLVKQGIPLPEGTTPSEKKLIDKVRAEMGLPPSPKTQSEKGKYAEAHAAGLITPLEGKNPAQKEKILRALAAKGIPFPEGRTPSEKALINKVKTEIGAPMAIPSAKLRAAKAAGLLTPLEGKSPAQKEKILKGLGKLGIPLPEGKTPSEKKLIDKVRAEMGLPPTPKTPSAKEKYAVGQAAGLITPLEGKTPAQKEKILRALVAKGIPLPEGRTASEKALVNKIKAEMPMGVPSAKLRAAKAAGLLTPLAGKTPEQKEKKLRGLAKQGLQLPEGTTPSEKKIIDKIRNEMGLPPEPKTPSVRAKYAKAQAAGIITPLEGKTQAEKEKILRNLANAGIPLPGGKTPSEKKLIDKVRVDMGLPPLPKTAAENAKQDAAIAAGVIVPLEGKTKEEKAKTLAAQAAMGLPLPEGRTPSEKSLIAKIKNAKVAGLLTPLTGKTPAQREKILRGLAEAGLPLPEGKTPSEKSMIHKIQTELGIPPDAITPSEREVVRKARAAGLFTPLTGKTPEQKEKILRGLAEAGLPMPVGKTPSEKAMIKRIRAAAGLPPEPTPSEKQGKIKTKTKKVGGDAISARARGLKAPGIVEEFQDVLKTTKCDRGCGCDKKKIRFKHSYVKIRVTSPDISSLCPCPEECVPGVKGGVFVDNEGIKVTVGSAVGFPAFTIENEYKNHNGTHANKKKLFSKSSGDLPTRNYKDTSNLNKNKLKEIYTNFYNSFMKSNHSSYIRLCTLNNDSAEIDYEISISNTEQRVSRYLIAFSESDSTPPSASYSNFTLFSHGGPNSSSESIAFVRTESSLSFSPRSGSIFDTSSIITCLCDIMSTNSHSLCSSRSNFSLTNDEDFDYHKNIFVSSVTANNLSSESYTITMDLILDTNRRSVHRRLFPKNETIIYRMSHEIDHQDSSIHNKSHKRKVVRLNDLNSSHDIYKLINKIIEKKEIAVDESSLFVIVSASDNYKSSDRVNSIVCTRMSDDHYYGGVLTNSIRAPKSSRGIKFYMGVQHKSAPKCNQFTAVEDNQDVEITSRCKDNNTKRIGMEPLKNKRKCRGFGMDTISDRPCCCNTGNLGRRHSISFVEQKIGNVISEIINPIMTEQSVAQGLSRVVYQDMSIIPPCQTSFQLEAESYPRSTVSCHNYYQQSNYRQFPRSEVLKPLGTDKDTQCCFPNSRGRRNALLPCEASKICVVADKNMSRSIGCGPICPKKTELIAAASPGTDLNSMELSCRACSNKNVFTDKSVRLPQINEQGATGDQLRPCPCPPSSYPNLPPGTLLSEGTQYTEDGQQWAFKDCDCEAKRSKKKIHMCECPPALEESPEVFPSPASFEQPFDYGYSYEQEYDATADLALPTPSDADKREERKLKSDLTQTTSGFNMKFKKRAVVEDVDSIYDDALLYFELFRISESESNDSTTLGIDNRINCDCDDKGRPKKKKKHKNLVCECPPSEEPVYWEPIFSEASATASPPETELKGFKLKIGGKGSESKGLSGMCCFDRLINKAK